MNYHMILDQKVDWNVQPLVPEFSPFILAILQSFEQPFILLGTNSVIIFLNQTAREIINGISGQIPEPGESILNVFTNEQHLGIAEKLVGAFDGKNFIHEMEFVHCGQAIWLDCNFKSIIDEYGIPYVGLHLKDITQKKKEEQRESEKTAQGDMQFESKLLLQTFMENTPLLAWVADENGVMHYTNPALKRGYSLPANDGPISMDLLFSEDLVEEYRENNLLALNSGHMIEVLERAIKPDGTPAIYKVFKFPMTIGNDTMVGGWAVEITEEAKLQEQLTNSIERYNFVNEATSDAIYDWEISNNIIYRGKGFALLFGYHEPYITLDYRFTRIHPSDVKKIRSVYLNALEDPRMKRWNVKYRFKDAKGIYRNVVDKAFIIRENDKAIRVIGAIQDITEYNQLQEKLVLQEESKKRAIVRSIIETQEKERRQLSVELHDNVNQILSSCKLMLELAKENKEKAPLLTEKSYQSIQLAIAEIRKISHNLNPSAVEDFGLKEAIAEMVDKINLSEKVKVNFKFSTGKKALLNSEDKIAIYRIIQEQLNNIVKHADAKNVLVEIAMKSSQVHLLIEDDCNGFNSKKANTGIGLKNIHHRVEYYHGTISIVTARKKGCRMIITLNIFPNR